MKYPCEVVMKISKTRAGFLVLIFLLILSLSYIVVDKYNEKKQKEQLRIYSSGVKDGFRQAIIVIMQQASTCREVPLFYNNKTINVIAVECLKKE